MWIALSGNLPPAVISDLVKNRLQDQFQTVPGVGEVTLGGFRARSLRVWLDAKKLEARDLTVTDVLAALRREHVEIPAGRIESAERELNVRAEGEAATVDEFANLVISDAHGSQILLRDVAIVEDGLEDKRRVSRMNGQTAQGMGIRKQRGSNAVEVGEAVKLSVQIRKSEVGSGHSHLRARVLVTANQQRNECDEEELSATHGPLPACAKVPSGPRRS
jgi:multidrug efflux pump subunit AcrB